jgi:RNA polymerase sigma factor (sigma-70 family)
LSRPYPISQSDKELWAKLRRGDKNALRIIFLRYHDSLFQYGLTICSKEAVIEDCLQELFFYLWKKKSSLSQVTKVKGYLWISFRRRLMRQLKQNRSDATLSDPDAQNISKEPSIEQVLIGEEQDNINSEALNSVIETLSQREREVLFLKYYEGMNYSEIEEILDVEYQTARNYIYRAITRLRDALEDQGIKIVLSIMLIVVLS